jgi:hypothetical protein
MGNGGGLSRGFGSGHRCGIVHVTRGAVADEAAADLLRNVTLTTGKGLRSPDRLTGTVIARSL